MRNKKDDHQLVLEFSSPEELAERARRAKEIAEWLNAPSPPPPPPLPPLPGWETVIPNKTCCKILRSHRDQEDIGKVVVIREVDHGSRSVWASFDEPAVYRENLRGRWVCEWNPLCARRVYSMTDLEILSEPWVEKPPIRKPNTHHSKYNRWR